MNKDTKKPGGIIHYFKGILTSNNLVPIVVALIPIIAGNKYLDYRITQIENKIPSKENIAEVGSKLDSFILFQDKINNLVLNYISSRPAEGTRLEYPIKESDKKESLKKEVLSTETPKKDSVYSYYINMAKYLLMESNKKKKPREGEK
jgi:hypothetical protein